MVENPHLCHIFMLLWPKLLDDQIPKCTSIQDHILRIFDKYIEKIKKEMFRNNYLNSFSHIKIGRSSWKGVFDYGCLVRYQFNTFHGCYCLLAYNERLICYIWPCKKAGFTLWANWLSVYTRLSYRCLLSLCSLKSHWLCSSNIKGTVIIFCHGLE